MRFGIFLLTIGTAILCGSFVVLFDFLHVLIMREAYGSWIGAYFPPTFAFTMSLLVLSVLLILWGIKRITRGLEHG